MLNQNARLALWLGVLLGAVVSIALLLVGGSSIPEFDIVVLGIIGALLLTLFFFLIGWISGAPVPIGKPVRACIAFVMSSLVMALLCVHVWPRVSVSPTAMSFYESQMEGQNYRLTVSNGKLYDVFAVLVKVTFNTSQPEFAFDVPQASCKPLAPQLGATSINDCLGLSCSNDPYSFNVYFYRLTPGEKREIIVTHTKNTTAHGDAHVRFFEKKAVPSSQTTRGALVGFGLPLNIGDEGDGHCKDPQWVFFGSTPGQLAGPPSVQPTPGPN